MISLHTSSLQHATTTQLTSRPALVREPSRPVVGRPVPARHHRRACAGRRATSNGNGEGEQPSKPFDGIGWVVQKGAELREEEDAAQQQQSQQATAVLPPRGGPPSAGGNGLPERDERALAAAAAIDELVAERKPFHRRLGRAAQQADVKAAEAVLQEMAEAGLPPGQRAFHGLIFAYTKAFDPNGAWDASKRASDAGVLLMAESFILLIHAYMQEGMVMDAQVLLARMQESPHVDARPGWLVLLQSLLKGKHHRKAAEELARGQQQGWAANAQVYEAMITALCDKDHLSDAIDTFNRMKREGVVPTTRHVYPILRKYAKGGSLEFLQERVLLDVATSTDIRIDADCYNCLLRGYIDNRNRGFGYSMLDKLKYEVEGLMAKYEVEPNARFHALQVEGFICEGDVECMQEATGAFKEMARRAVQERKKREEERKKPYPADWPMPQDVLKQYLLTQAMMAPADLLKSLLAMQKAGFKLPDIAPNEIGLSIVTSWLHERFARLCSVGYRSEVPAADMDAGMREQLDADQDDVDGDGQPATRVVSVLDPSERDENDQPMFVDIEVNAEGGVLDTDGKLTAPSKLTVLELTAELQARGLMTEGSRRELYKRVQAARRSSAGSTSVAQTKRDLAASHKKYMKERGQKEVAREASKREVARLEEGVMREDFGDGAVREELTLDPELLGLDQFDEDDEEEEDEEPKAAAVEAQSGADDDADEEDEEDSDAEDADDDTAADVTGSGRFDEEEDMFVGLDDPQLDFALKYFNTNFRAQTNDALRVLRAVEALGGRATPEDIAMLVKGVVAEQNTRLAGPMFDVVCRYEEDLGEEMTSMLFCALLEMLLSAEQPGNAKVLHQRMEDVGYEADGVLLRQLHWQIKSSQPADRREAVAV